MLKKPSGDQVERPHKLGRERQVHKEILKRLMEGGAPRDAEAYARAVEQWQQLPGSVMRPATDVQPSVKKPKSANVSTGSESAAADD